MAISGAGVFRWESCSIRHVGYMYICSPLCPHTQDDKIGSGSFRNKGGEDRERGGGKSKRKT